MTRIISLCTFALAAQLVVAQVPKKTVVEHFTNSKCSICASRNPGFYNNISSQFGVLHLSIYPSAPYSGCQIYQQNPVENDARTNYYGIYGGTPRLVINGNVISSAADYGSNSLFTPYQAQMSPASIQIRQQKFGSDSIRSTIVIKTVATHTLGPLLLFAALAEDTVFYTGSNGEPKHFNVFRKSLGSVTGINVTLPAAVGDSVVYSAAAPAQSFWNFNRINTYAILQETGNKNLVQSEKYGSASLVTGMASLKMPGELRIYPNPGNGIYFIDNPVPGAFVEVRNALGAVLLYERLEEGSNRIDVSAQPNGLYFASILLKGKIVSTAKLVLTKD